MEIKAKDLEPMIGSKGHVSAILSEKREITLKMAQKLKTTSVFLLKCFYIVSDGCDWSNPQRFQMALRSENKKPCEQK